MLEDDRVLLNTFDEAAAEGGPVMVRIGHENKDSALDNISIVAARYGEEDECGFVAVVGPTRMDYGRVIRAVRAAQNALQDD